MNIACRRINFSLGFRGSFDAVICKHFSVHVKKHFLILHGMVLTHALWNGTFSYSEVPSSFLVNTVQTLSKSVYNCQSYWQKFRGHVFLWPLCIMSVQSRGQLVNQQNSMLSWHLRPYCHMQFRQSARKLKHLKVMICLIVTFLGTIVHPTSRWIHCATRWRQSALFFGFILQMLPDNVHPVFVWPSRLFLVYPHLNCTV